MTEPGPAATTRGGPTGGGPTLPIAVVGAGFSGTMAALHLLPRIGRRQILLCERGERFARGVAYGTEDPAHLLNVRAANMSAYPDRPDHFERWLDRNGNKGREPVHPTAAGIFVSRHLYGNYLVDLLNDAVTGAEGAARLILVADEVVDLAPTPEGYRLTLAGGVRHDVAGVVLAAGNLLPPDAALGPIVNDPWGTPFAEGLREGEPVVVVGSGLSMVDIALHLRRSGFAGPVVAVSRRGLKSHTHVPTTAWPIPAFTDRERRSPAQLLRRVRWEVAAAGRAGVAWQSVVDSLRPVTSELWRGFPAQRQDSFLRHARPWWDIHRHRMAPPVSGALDAMLTSGFLQVRAGHVREIRPRKDGVDVVLQPRGETRTVTIAAQRLIHASGNAAPDRCAMPLLERLIARGLVRPDPRGLGLDQDADLLAIGAEGGRTPRLWALGPLGTGAFWECVAVPDIRQQAVRLADTIAEAVDRVG